MNELALERVIAAMKQYRPNLTAAFIKQVIQDCLNSGAAPKAEITQDIWWAYQRELQSSALKQGGKQ